MKRDTKYVLQILVLFIPIPAFWALFDQQGSRWTLQAISMDGHLVGEVACEKVAQINFTRTLLFFYSRTRTKDMKA